MSPTIFGCVVCGYLIDSYARSSWLKEFRAIYSSPDGIFLSGVGRYNDPGGGSWIAPSDPNMRWDDHDYHFSPTDELPVMQQPSQDGRHGFVLHDSCWSLLQVSIQPARVPIERLLAICQSLPFPLKGIGVCWGHDYGGLVLLDDKNHYPWEDRLTGDFNISRTNAKDNPYNIPGISELLATSQQPVDLNQRIAADLIPATQGTGHFTILPWEIVEAIAVNLQTVDVLNLATASRFFLPLLTSQSFWASAFNSGHECDFVFETRNSKKARNWITLYKMINHSCSPPGLKNRRRIWKLIKALTGSLCTRLDETLESCRMNLKTDSLRWNEVAGDIHDRIVSECGRPAPFNVGCRLFLKQCTSMPSNLAKIAFSVIFLSESIERVTGIRLISDDNTDICLGYVTRSQEVFLEIITIQGLILAVGSQGVHAIQVINSDGYGSRWFGCPEHAPITERLTGFESIAALEVGVDGYKMVSIAAAGPMTRGTTSLRSTGLWYPRIPNSDVFLNEESFTGEDPLTSGYQPLICCQFGGPKGMYLQSLMGVCVTQLGNLCCIEFQYNTENVPLEIRKLGRRKVTEFSRTKYFQIDGPGGELLQSVSVRLKQVAGEGI